MEGTHNPTNTPASLFAAAMPKPNHSEIENKNERNAAAKINQSAFVNNAMPSKNH